MTSDNQTPKRKLIEVALPLEVINRESAREKSIRHGHPSTLHLWWARRPLAAARAVLFAQLVNDPGYHRAGILTALLNSTTLIFVAGYIFYEAYQRFISPPEVNSGILIGVGIVAFLINAGTAWLVQRGSEHDLNLRSAFVHLMGDVFSTIGAVIAGIIIAFTGLNWLDPLVSVLIGVLILWNAWGILKDTIDILLESTPRDVDTKKLVENLLKVEGVKGVHDLHVWSITQSLRALSAHIHTDDVSISNG